MTTPINIAEGAAQAIARIACHVCHAYGTHEPTCALGQTDELLEVAVAWRKTLKRIHPNDEETMLTEFDSICRRLADGDETKGALLAQKAIWTP